MSKATNKTATYEMRGTGAHAGWTVKFTTTNGEVKVENFRCGQSQGYPECTDVDGGRMMWRRYCKHGFVYI